MSEKKYSKKHEWIMLDGETATVGISKHATETVSYTHLTLPTT